MDPQWRTYHSRMQSLERNLADHDNRFNQFDARNETHSAKLKTLERQLEDLKFDNSRLYNEVVSLRSHENPAGQHIVSFRTDQPPDAYRSGPGTDRINNRDVEAYRERPGQAQMKKDLDRIEMHEGNFKPYASNYYQDHLKHRNPIDYKSTGNIESLSKPESGVYLFIRTHKDALTDVRKSFQRHKTTLSQSGHLTGIALPDQIKVTGDYNNWQLRRGPWYDDRRENITEYHTDYIMIVLWFPSAKAAQSWIDYDQDFKIASFPAPYGVDMIIVPINYIPPEDASCRTFLLSEYPDVKQPDYFRTEIIEPMRDILRDYVCEPFVVRTNGVAPIRGSWIGQKSTIAVHRFSSEDEAIKFYHDPRTTTLRGKLNGVTRGGRHTTVRFTVTETI